MSSIPEPRATPDDLLRVTGKAELIGGRIVRWPPSGHLPSVVTFEILKSLDDHAESIGVGYAFTGSLGYLVPELPSGRESFSPDASYYVGPPPARRMWFVEGPPTFAVEVRSEGDYGKSADLAIAAKRADYFAAGTLAYWDVDPEAEEIRTFRASDPMKATIYRRGDVAEAEPAVPGWRVEVDVVFPAD